MISLIPSYGLTLRSLQGCLAIFFCAATLSCNPPVGQETRESWSSREEAARRALNDAWGLHYEYYADRDGLRTAEFGGLLFESRQGGFSYTQPRVGTTDGVDVSSMLYERAGGGWQLPSGERVVGAYHIHPVDQRGPGGVAWDNERFSPQDMEFSEHYGFPIYLRTPGDRYRVYDPQVNEPSDGPSSWGSLPLLPPESPRAASLGGEPHIRSHDGYHLPFQAAGEFIAVMRSVPATAHSAEVLPTHPTGEKDDLSIMVRLEPYGPSISVVTAVAIQTGGQRIGIYRDPPHLRIDGQDAEAQFGAALYTAAVLDGGGSIRRNETQAAEVTTKQGDLIRVQNLTRNWLDLVVRLADSRRGTVAGLLGNYDGDPSNELMTRSGRAVSALGLSPQELKKAIYETWGGSWRVSPEESAFDYDRGRTAKTYQIVDFPKAVLDFDEVLSGSAAPEALAACRAAGLTDEAAVRRCGFDVVVTGDTEFAISHAALEMAVRDLGGAPVAVAPPRPAFEANLAEVHFGATVEATLSGSDYSPRPKDPMSVVRRNESWASLDRRDWPAGTVPTITLMLPGTVPPRVVALRILHEKQENYRLERLALTYSEDEDGDRFRPIVSFGVSASSDESLLHFAPVPARRLRLELHPSASASRVEIYSLEAFEAADATPTYDALVRIHGRSR